VRGDDEADGGGEEDECEEVADPVEAFEEVEAGGDEGSAHEDGAEDSPEEDARLEGFGDLEDAEEQEEDEEIVDREGLFDGVAGKELGGGCGAQGGQDERGEGEGDGDPHRGRSDGVAMLADGASFGVETGQAPAGEDQLRGEQDQQGQMERDPVGDGGGHLA